MIFEETRLPGAYLIRLEPRADARGFFARSWCQHEFAEHGLADCIAQANVSYNTRRGTLRGMHWQEAPFAETKLVRCTRGAIFDAIVDLRPDSPSYRQWYGAELSAENRSMLYVPEGFAHGFLTLDDDTEVTYQVSQFYTPGAERGARHDDPAFGIVWPLPIEVISDKDRTWPDYDDRRVAAASNAVASGVASRGGAA
jgi:dTDP-4-dehydrorhamnose 3,5-epimerase